MQRSHRSVDVQFLRTSTRTHRTKPQSHKGAAWALYFQPLSSVLVRLCSQVLGLCPRRDTLEMEWNKMEALPNKGVRKKKDIRL